MLNDSNLVVVSSHEFDGNESSATINGLQKGKKYSLTIHAYNCLGKAGESTLPLTVKLGQFVDLIWLINKTLLNRR